MTTWDEVEESVACALLLAMPAGPCGYVGDLDDGDYKALARAAIDKIRELRLTAVMPDV